MGEEERLRALNRPLLDWFHRHARALPWREDPAPYRVWVSEVMLQQTRVEAVKPYFERFLAELPDIGALALAEEDRLMALWQGLGYYNRAKNLKKAARVIQEDYHGRMPSEYEELLKLPGIGRYTAGAIASIAFGKAVPAVDGNVLRVLSRVLASYRDVLRQSTRNWMEDLLRETMPQDHVSQFNQGLMEVGALVCVPNGAPHCGECPLACACLSQKGGLTDRIPVKTPPKRRRVEEITVCILDNGRQVALRKRDGKGLLASLYEFPNMPGHRLPGEVLEAFSISPDEVACVERLPDAKHIFSHIEWHMVGYRIHLKGALPGQWVAASKDELRGTYALPNAFDRYICLAKE